MKSPTSQRVRSSGENRPRRLSATLLVVCFVVMFAVPLLTITAPHASAEPGWWNYNWTRRRPITITIPSWYSSSWPYRKQITIDHTKVENENFTNFPVLISITDTDLASKAQDDGDDILFTASNGTTKLPHEIENFHKASGTLVAWVRVPTLYDNENTYIYMYYGNATCSSQQNATGVWDGNFKGVWHLSDATTSLIDNFFEYGSEGVFNPAATAYETSSTVALDSRHVLIAYRDSANSNYGTAVIATISGTGTAATVSFGSEYVFNDASTLDISAVALSETKVLIAYRDVGNSNKGTAIIATISGSTITHGSEYVFNDASTDFISATKTSENVLIAYRDVGNSNKGTAIMANISGNTITYGSEHVFNNGDAPQIHAGTPFAYNKALITFDNVLNSGRGTACVATVSGLAISFGASTVFESGSPNYTNLTVLSSSLAVTSYEIEDDDWEAYVRPLTISGTTVTAGTRSNIGVGHDEEGIAYGAGAAAALDSTHVIVIYRDNDNSGYGTTKIGTVSGTGASATVTFGPKKGFNQSSICAVSAARLDRIHALITYRDDANLYGTAIVATIHGYGTANDSTSNNNDGTIHRSLRALGKVGSGMNFDGGDNYINVPDTDSLDFTTAMTVEAWINADTLTGWRCIAAKDGYVDGEFASWSLWASYGIDNHPAFFLREESGFAWGRNITLNAGQWYHIAATYSGSQTKIYVNGNLENTTNYATPIETTAFPLYIGCDARGEYPQSPFDGTIDDVRVSNTARSSAWIKTSYNNQSSPSTFYSVRCDNLENYQIKIIVPYDLDMHSDYGDLRFTENDSGPELSYWIENYTADNATVWVRRLESTDNTIYVYYRNPTATTTSDVSATFIRVIENVRGSWSMDENTGTTTKDNSGYNNNGTLLPAGSEPTWATGKFNSALNFDGTNDYVGVGNLTESQAYTFEAWMKTTQSSPDTDTAVRLITIRRTLTSTKIALAMRENKAAMIWYDGSAFKNLKSPSTYNDELWHHIVGTTDGTNFTFYVDGAQVASTTSTLTTATTTTQDLIGTSADGASGFFKGTLDEVKVYNRALDNTEVSTLYNYYGYATTNYQGRVLVRKFVSPEPTVSIGGEQYPPPGQPQLQSPEDGAILSDNTPTFIWTIGENADNHRLLIDNDSDFNSPKENQLLGASDNTYTIADGNALPDGIYYWKVVAINAGEETSSSVWTFTVSRIGRPTLVWPENGVVTTDSTPTFEWIIGAYAENHRLLIDNDPDFSSPNENRLFDNIKTTFTVPDNEALPDDNYYWKVIAISEIAKHESSVWTFTMSKITVALNVQDWIGRAHGSRATIAFDALPLQYRENLDGSLLRSASIAPEYWKLYGADKENTFTYSENEAVYWLRRARDNYRNNNYDNALYDMGIASYYIGDAMTLPRNDNLWENASKAQYPSGWSLYRHFQEQARYYEPATPSPQSWRPTLDDYIENYMLSYLDNYARGWENDWSYWVSTRDCGYVKSASDNATQLIYDAWYSLLYEGSAGGGGGPGPAPRGGAGASDGGAVGARWSFGLLSFGFGAALFLTAAIFTRRSSLGSGRRRHSLRKDKRGVSPVVGAVLVLSILVIAGTTFVTHWIPELQLKNEMDHTDAALDTWRKLQQAILNHENAKIEVKLGADPASILGLFEQAQSPGTITVTPAKYVMRILPDNDAYVGEDVSSGGGNLLVQTYKDNNRRAYLKFDLSSLPADARIYEARLVMNAKISSFPHTWNGKTGYSPVPMLVAVMKVDDDNWSEGTISWATGYGDALVNEDRPSENTWDISYEDDIGTWYTFNVSSYVKGQRAGDDNLISLCLKAPREDSTLKRYAWFRSKESSGYRPYLQITYESVLENSWRSFDSWGSIADSGSVVFNVPNKRYDQYSFVFEGGALIKELYRENPIFGTTDQEEYEGPQQPSSQAGGPILVANPPFVVGQLDQQLEGDNIRIYVNRYRIINRATYTGTGKAFLNVTVRENENLRWENSYDNVMVAIRSDRPQAWVGADPLFDGGYFTSLAGITRGEWGSLDYSLGAESSDLGDISVRDFYANAITIYGRRLAAGIKDIIYVERVYDVTIDITTT